MKYILIVVMALLAFSACKTKEATKSEEKIEIAAENAQLKQNINLEGTLKKQGVTTYQYGSHVLKTADSFYALRSTDLDLNAYVDKEVKITAEKIKGYPVSGGPDFLLVKHIELKK